MAGRSDWFIALPVRTWRRDKLPLGDVREDSLTLATALGYTGENTSNERDDMSEYDYEPAENSAAKDVVMDALEAELDKQGVTVYTDDDNNEGGIDLIDLADAVVESLLKVGATIPEDLKSPHWR